MNEPSQDRRTGPSSPGGSAPGLFPARAALGACEAPIRARLAAWSRERASERVWEKDPTFWPAATPEDVRTRLGWLGLPESMRVAVEPLTRFAAGVREEGFQHVLLLGMGGSSLAPEVYARTFGPAPGYPELGILDSTHPDGVRAAFSASEISRTLFVVSSKSGTTLEPNAFFHYAWARVSAAAAAPGRQFVAITDPGTPLEELARARSFRRCFIAPPDVGGRYAALTAFGLVPLSLLGHDPTRLLASAQRMARACGPEQGAEESPGLWLGAVLVEAGLAGRDKIVFVASRGVRTFPNWAEQLVAESLGKQGRGLVPVPQGDRPIGPTGAPDELLVHLRLRGEPDPALDRALDAREAEGVPVLRFDLDLPDDLGQEFFRWELAIASAGAALRVDPFDQPDVEVAKELAREAMGPPKAGRPTSARAPVPVRADPTALSAPLDRWLASARRGDYAAIQAFLAPVPGVLDELDQLAVRLRSRSGLATTLGRGPRFLHSTGQMHKGGPPTGLFLQVVDEPATDLEVPGMALSFARILRAQADGDAAALLQRGRRLLRVNVGSAPIQGLQALGRALDA